MNIGQLSEDRLVAQLTKRFARSAAVKVGIGDDCAAVTGPASGQWLLLKTDCVVEGVHYLSGTSGRKVGWKALARPLSDIAAMGGLPRQALVTVAISRQKSVRYLDGIFAGIDRIARLFDVHVVGGETSQSPGADFISICVSGVVEKRRCVTRSGGRPGDRLYVTGRLGGSLHGKHLAFTPRVLEARWLTAHFRIRAMMDLSDGLGADLPRLAAASGAGFDLCEGDIPCTKGSTPQEAISDGEDYELLFALAARDASRLESEWKKAFPRLTLTCIGSLTPRSARRQVLARGYVHFAQP